jgi:hypothetical protein
MSTNDYLDKLTIDQLRYARDEADRRIKTAELKPKKIVWVVSTDSYNDSWYREEDFEKAYVAYLKLLDKLALEKMKEFIKDRPGTRYFGVPTIQPTYENEVEYEEWFK